MKERLQEILDTHGLPCGAVIGPSAEVVAMAGDFIEFGSAGLVSAMLGPHGSAEATYKLVQNPEQVKPVVWGQGEEFAFLDCVGELVVVVFGRNRGDILARAALSRQVGQTIAVTFADQT